MEETVDKEAIFCRQAKDSSGGLGQDRKARLWDALRPTFNHDLPNMLVALQGLLQMLKQEQENQFSPAGREYLQRLLALSQKLQVTAGGLRAINKICTPAISTEPVLLAELLPEVAATVKKLVTKNHLVLHTFLKVPQVVLPRAFLQQTLIEIIRLLACGAGEGMEFRCFLISRAGPQQTELILGEMHTAPGTSLSGEAWPQLLAGLPRDISSLPSLDYNLFGVDNRLGLIVIEETVAAWGGRVKTHASPDQGNYFCLTIPSISQPTPKPVGSADRLG